MAAETNIVGPGSEPCRTCTGSATGAWFDSFEIGRSTSRRSPGFTDNPPMTKGCLMAAFCASHNLSTTHGVHVGCASARSPIVDRSQYWQTKFLCTYPRSVSFADNIAVHTLPDGAEQLHRATGYLGSLLF